jgi:hypothetical protein
MAAIFHTYSNNVFKLRGSSSGLVSVGSFDSAADSEGMLTMYTDVDVHLVEVTQFFLTFADQIRYIHFGKGVGTVTVRGVCFSKCSGELPGASAFYSIVQGQRGKRTDISVADYKCGAVLVDVQTNLTAEPDTMMNYTLTFNIVED